MRVISSLSWQTKDGVLQQAVVVVNCNNRTPQPTTQRKRIWIYLSGPRRMLLDAKQALKRSRMIAPRLAICIQFWVFSIAIVLLPLFHSAGNFVFFFSPSLKNRFALSYAKTRNRLAFCEWRELYCELKLRRAATFCWARSKTKFLLLLQQRFSISASDLVSRSMLDFPRLKRDSLSVSCRSSSMTSWAAIRAVN